MSNIGYVNIGLTALANGAQAGALQLSTVAYLNQFSTCTAAANSCLLPMNPPYGLICKIRNDSASNLPLNVFPQVGGQINGLAANVQYLLPVDCLAEFVAISGLNWLISSSSYSNGNNACFSYINLITIPDLLGVAYNVSVGQSGSTFLIANQSVNVIFNIPSALLNAGLNYKFEITGATAGHTITITPAGGTFYGSLINSIPGGVTCLECSAKANIVFAAIAEVGSTLNLISDGTDYNASGVGTLDGVGWA